MNSKILEADNNTLDIAMELQDTIKGLKHD